MTRVKGIYLQKGGASGLWIWGGICLLFFFVSMVPHRYIQSYGHGGFLINNLRWLPSLVISGILVLLVWCRGGILQGSLILPLVALLILNLLGAVGSEVPSLGISREIYYFWTGGLVGLVAFCGLERGYPLARFLEFLFVVSVCVAGYGIYEFVFGVNPIWGYLFRQENILYAQFAHDASLFGVRIRSTVGHPVFLGTYLLLCLPVGIAIANNWKGWTRFFSWCGVLLLASALTLTFSRGAWVSAGMACLIYFRRMSVRHIVLAGTVFGVFLVSILSFERVWDTLEQRGTLDQLMRFKHDRRGIAYLHVSGMIQDRPLWGIGTAHYRFMGSRYQDYDGTPDNMYLRIIGENGITGFSALLVLFGVIFRRLSSAENSFFEIGQFHQANLCRGILASVCGFWVNLVTCDALYFSLTRITFWLLVGTGYCLSKDIGKEPDSVTII
tara:strand:- start:11259 stop:12584 length:1326 start_codon:yes stop_codon:yes gene_type:complete